MKYIAFFRKRTFAECILEYTVFIGMHSSQEISSGERRSTRYNTTTSRCAGVSINNICRTASGALLLYCCSLYLENPKKSSLLLVSEDTVLRIAHTSSQKVILHHFLPASGVFETGFKPADSVVKLIVLFGFCSVLRLLFQKNIDSFLKQNTTLFIFVIEVFHNLKIVLCYQLSFLSTQIVLLVWWYFKFSVGNYNISHDMCDVNS